MCVRPLPRTFAPTSASDALRSKRTPAGTRPPNALRRVSVSVTEAASGRAVTTITSVRPGARAFRIAIASATSASWTMAKASFMAEP